MTRSIRDRHGHVMQSPTKGDLGKCDASILLAAGDELAGKVMLQHPASPELDWDGQPGALWCEGCDGPESDCWAVVAAARWKKVTDG
jgi:hypothetical protein